MRRHPPIRFPSTRWTLLADATRGGGRLSREAMGQLLGRYLRPLETYLIRSRGMGRSDAEDMVQSFVTRRVLEQNLLVAADQSRGRFRTFLLTALNRFVADEYRKAARPMRLAAAVGSLPEGVALPGREPDPRQAFDVAWGQEVLSNVLERMHAQCEQSQRPQLWEVFEARVLLPALHDGEPVPYQRLAERLGIESDEKAANLLVTAKRMFQRLLREVIREYADDEDDIETEVVELKQVLSRGW